MTRLSSDEGQTALLKEHQEEIKLLKQQAITLQQTTAAAISKAEKKGNSDLEGKTKTAIMTAMKEALATASASSKPQITEAQMKTAAKLAATEALDAIKGKFVKRGTEKAVGSNFKAAAEQPVKTFLDGLEQMSRIRELRLTLNNERVTKVVDAVLQADSIVRNRDGSRRKRSDSSSSDSDSSRSSDSARLSSSSGEKLHRSRSSREKKGKGKSDPGQKPSHHNAGEFCSRCGTSHLPDAGFCSKCGTKLI